MLVYAWIQSILMKKSMLKSWQSKFFVFLDTSLVFLVIIAGMFETVDQTAAQLKSSILYSIFFFAMIYSSFLLSPRFNLFMTCYVSLCLTLLLITAYFQGVEFTNKAGTLNTSGILQTSNEIIKIFFAIALGITMYYVNCLMVAMRDAIQLELDVSESEKL